MITFTGESGIKEKHAVVEVKLFIDGKLYSSIHRLFFKNDSESTKEEYIRAFVDAIKGTAESKWKSQIKENLKGAEVTQ